MARLFTNFNLKKMTKEIDQSAREYNKTKDKKYYKEWINKINILYKIKDKHEK